LQTNNKDKRSSKRERRHDYGYNAASPMEGQHSSLRYIEHIGRPEHTWHLWRLERQFIQVLFRPQRLHKPLVRFGIRRERRLDPFALIRGETAIDVGRQRFWV
jgi:hypothetical protein